MLIPICYEYGACFTARVVSKADFPCVAVGLRWILSKNSLPEATLSVSNRTARRFLLAHQRLWPPRKLRGKEGVLEFIRHVGCIQYDPLNVVGRNPDLVLNARLSNYKPAMLDEMLYSNRILLDGIDKVASIFPVEDYPSFERRRAHMRERYSQPDAQVMEISTAVLAVISEQGPLSSLDIQYDQKIDWSWGPTRAAKAALEALEATGELGVHNRSGTRRYYDLRSRLIPSHLIARSDPYPTMEDYWDWHVLRRVGGLGLSNPGASEYWLGILEMKSRQRQESLRRLVERGKLVAVEAEGAPRTLFMRAEDLPLLENVQRRGSRGPRARAAFIGPLDNLMWDRDLLRWLFDFDYIWEVYKPAHVRRYGYYVLPVLFGDRFIARWDPAFDKKTRALTIQNWWWEADVRPAAALKAALVECFQQLVRYLNIESIALAPTISSRHPLRGVIKNVEFKSRL